MLFLQFFIAQRSEAKAPVALFRGAAKKESCFSKSSGAPVADHFYGSPGVSTITQLRRHLPTGGLPISILVVNRLTYLTPSGVTLGKEAFCIPMARRLLFPRHYFW